ncbi:MAG TPA: hemolysin III family protein [Urbifossiella sp.]|jgi:hemolysin III|nr:hemolysin III family protein [Urbifossiella sp.]
MELRDPVSSASHLLTAVWAAYATLILIRLTPPRSAKRWSVVVFGLSMVLLYAASGTFHGVPYTRVDDPDAFRFFQKLDQSAILLLIAGTNTPILVVLLGGRKGIWFLRLMWGLAAVGVACLWVLPKAPHWALVAIYLAMGWLGVVPVVHYYRLLGWRAMNWMWAGAGFYTIGAVCELVEWPVLSEYPVRFGYHEVLHLCDTAASASFFVFVVRVVLPFVPRPVLTGPGGHRAVPEPVAA